MRNLVLTLSFMAIACLIAAPVFAVDATSFAAPSAWSVGDAGTSYNEWDVFAGSAEVEVEKLLRKRARATPRDKKITSAATSQAQLQSGAADRSGAARAPGGVHFAAFCSTAPSNRRTRPAAAQFKDVHRESGAARAAAAGAPLAPGGGRRAEGLFAGNERRRVQALRRWRWRGVLGCRGARRDVLKDLVLGGHF